MEWGGAGPPSYGDFGNKEALRQLVVNFLLQEQYLLTAFELLHELLEDGQASAASKLQDFFADQETFPPDQLMNLQSLQGLDLQKLADEKQAAAELAAVREYELRIAKEDIKNLEEKLAKLEKKVIATFPSGGGGGGGGGVMMTSTAAGAESSKPGLVVAINGGVVRNRNAAPASSLDEDTCPPPPPHHDQHQGGAGGVVVVGEQERRELNHAVKDYLVSSGYKLTAMTFCEEVSDQEFDDGPCGGYGVGGTRDSLHRYYSCYVMVSNGREEVLRESVEEKEQRDAKIAQLSEEIEGLQREMQRRAAEEQERERLREEERAVEREREAERERERALERERERQREIEREREEEERKRREAEDVKNTEAVEETSAKVGQQTRGGVPSGPADASTMSELQQPQGEGAEEEEEEEEGEGKVVSDSTNGSELNQATEEGGSSSSNGFLIIPEEGEDVSESSSDAIVDDRRDTRALSAVSDRSDASGSSNSLTGAEEKQAQSSYGGSGSESGELETTTTADSRGEEEPPPLTQLLKVDLAVRNVQERGGKEEGEADRDHPPVMQQPAMDDDGHPRSAVRADDDDDEEEEEEVRRRQKVATTTAAAAAAAEEEMKTVRIIAESLPKIVPAVLIDKREELLPLIIVAIERHPESQARDVLTHGLFNLIKKPDEHQRKVIMNACVQLAVRIGEQRTEEELLPQCWEQINHKYPERRLLVAQSCGDLAQYVSPEIRTSLILSILLQLTEDPAPLIREAAARNLALLLPLFDTLEKYPKVEEIVFRLVGDSTGTVVDVALGTLVPSVVSWLTQRGGCLSVLLRSLLSRLVVLPGRCPPFSGVEGSVESQLRVLGERERWEIDVLLRMLTEILPQMRSEVLAKLPVLDFPGSGGKKEVVGRKAVERGEEEEQEGEEEGRRRGKLKGEDDVEEEEEEEEERKKAGAAAGTSGSKGAHDDDAAQLSSRVSFTKALLVAYTKSGKSWPEFESIARDLLPGLIQVACTLQPREDGLRRRICQLLLLMGDVFGHHFLAFVVLPTFLVSSGHSADTSYMPDFISQRIQSLKPSTSAGVKLASVCVLPLLLAGVLGSPLMERKYLASFLRDLVLNSSLKNGAWTSSHTPELINAFSFVCTFDELQTCLLGVLWELVMNPHAAVRVTASILLKEMVPSVDSRTIAQQVLPALVTLGSDPNVEVKYSTIGALGAVAQQCKDEAVVDKVRVQIDSFLEDGSHEALVGVVKTLTVAIPFATQSIREYLLHKVLILGTVNLGNVGGVSRKREMVEALWQAARALNGTEMSAQAVKEYYLPVLNSLVREGDLLDPGSREELEGLMRERSGNKFLAIGNAMSTTLQKTTMGTIFGDGGLLGGAMKKDNGGSGNNGGGAAAGGGGVGGVGGGSGVGGMYSLGMIAGAGGPGGGMDFGDRDEHSLPVVSHSYPPTPQNVAPTPPPQEEGRLKRMMRTRYEDLLRPRLRSSPSMNDR
ncbi:hypothetical protein CBR_g34722 [Chara braunii]|uniref:LisH domain-containing protein n=1 Tax=Chara braunii TaxID=69332 RepID=A0A388JYX4_CHABU|nr:hypothetical protein CBR_g34722 [Chara braunii]|eukprot:GBG63021.1 hypothetical protein CBR_g34722 [Chara braunii]